MYIELGKEIPAIFQYVSQLTLYVSETKIAEFSNSLDLDERAHTEPPHLDLHCFPSRL